MRRPFGHFRMAILYRLPAVSVRCVHGEGASLRPMHCSLPHSKLRPASAFPGSCQGLHWQWWAVVGSVCTYQAATPGSFCFSGPHLCPVGSGGLLKSQMRRYVERQACCLRAVQLALLLGMVVLLLRDLRHSVLQTVKLFN